MCAQVNRRHQNQLARIHLCVVGSARISLLWWFAFAVLIGLTAVYLWHYLETRQPVGQGLIELSSIELEHDVDQLHLRAGARIQLPPTVQAGLDSGVPLTFVLNLKISELQRFWLDKKVFDGERHYTLTYYELTRHYRVSELETDASRNFRSLSSALVGLGQLGRVSFALEEPQNDLLSRQGLIATLNMRLSKSALPLPLQPIIRSSWTLVSEEYRWPVT